ncbi:MAG TPA: response regulator transcription factor [Candidatus Peribacteraceae bacterium]|nr:response regulator transcription factor [Candidatus Peribacteraceae bacterium]
MPKTILIADDDPMIMQIVSLGMEQKNSDAVIRSTATGETTITSIEESVPDLIVLDIRMPGGDGFTVLEHLKKNKLSIPVVILTNYRTDAYIEKSRTYGVKDYLVKHELKLDGIISKVSSYL